MYGSGRDNKQGGKHVTSFGGRCSVGVRQTLLRGNGAPIHTLDNAFAKNPATTVPQTPLPNVTYAVGGVTKIQDRMK